jgi:Zn-dependent peptidase ImmA (M78 family)
MTPSSSEGGPSGIHLGQICAASRRLFDELNRKKRVSYPIQVKSGLIPQIAKEAGQGSAFEIRLKPKSWAANALFGYLRRYPEYAEIGYSLSLNTCWKRFVVCKELSHLLLDRSDSYTNDPVSLVQGLINSLPVINPSDDLLSEHVSITASVELLLPWCLRAELERMAKEGQSHLQIAQACRVPQKLITLMLSSNYGEVSKQANSGL